MALIFPAVRGRKKVLLFYPRVYPGDPPSGTAPEPISVIALAGHLLREGFDVAIRDSRTTRDWKSDLAAMEDELLLVGVSVMAGYQVADGYHFSRYVKERYPHLPLIWGGWGPTIFPDDCLENPHVDLLVRGQGEEILPEVARAIREGEPLDGIAGLSFRNGEGAMHNPIRPLKDLNLFLPVDYGLLDPAEYSIGQGVLHYVSSYGCPYSCTFCGVTPYFRRKWYGLRPERVVRELKTLDERYGIREVNFLDSTLFVDLNRVKEILRGFRRERLSFRWQAASHVSQMVRYDDEMFGLLRDTNCSCIELGIESGSKRIRELYRKDFDPEHLTRVLGKMADAGVPVRGNYIISPPTEERGDFMQTVRSMVHVKAASPKNSIVMYKYHTIPGTELERYEDIEETEGKPIMDRIEEWVALYESKGYEELFQRQCKPWLGRKDAIGRQPILFYVHLINRLSLRSGGIVDLLGRAVARIAAFRLKKEAFRLPLEWYLYRTLRFSLDLARSALPGARLR